MYVLILIIFYIITCTVIFAVGLLALHITTLLLNHRVGAYFGFRRRSKCGKHIHLGKLFYSFPVLVKYSPNKIREIFLNDLIYRALPETFKTKPECRVIIYTHLVTPGYLSRISGNENITYCDHKPDFSQIIFTQITAAAAWLPRIIITRQLYSFPKTLGRKWYKFTFTNPNHLNKHA
jgi:hypothetical protein